MPRRLVAPHLAAATLGLLGGPAWAQEHVHGMTDTSRASVTLGGMAVLVATQVNPAVRGRTLRELYLSQPMIMLHARTLGFLHPTARKYCEFTVDAPQDFFGLRAVLHVGMARRIGQ